MCSRMTAQQIVFREGLGFWPSGGFLRGFVFQESKSHTGSAQLCL